MPIELRKSAKAGLAFSLPARRHSSGKASHALTTVTVGVGGAQQYLGGIARSAAESQ